ncbi:adenosine deaminase [Erwinia billingiae]|uniref:adenosine deaminase n=1 Tax=Erwinia billingiae TaxID=182337 RepID=UPI000D0966AB|nr:adenosine deaminase [Erwinia billingiae]PRB56752.1 adenosine deaminase [Erwinia billingiae]
MIQDYANETFEAQELVVYAKALLRNHDFLRKLDQFFTGHPLRFDPKRFNSAKIRELSEAFNRGCFLEMRRLSPRATDEAIENRITRLSQKLKGTNYPRSSGNGSYYNLVELLPTLLHSLAETFLCEGNDGSIRVRSRFLDLWQDLILVVPPLLISCAWMTSRLRADGDLSPPPDRQKKVAHRLARWLCDSTLPVDDNPFLDYICRTHGLDEVHMHLNGTTESEKIWCDALKRPDNVIGQLLKAKLRDSGLRVDIGSGVTRQFHQEDSQLTPKLLRRRVDIAVFLKTALLNASLGENSFRTKIASVAKEVPIAAQFRKASMAVLARGACHSPSSVVQEAWQLCQIYAVFSFHRAKLENGLDLWHYTLLRAQFCRLLVQQNEQIGFDQFQYITQNELREFSEKDYAERFRQIERGHQRGIDYVEGRFAPKSTPDKTAALLTRILRGYLLFLTEDILGDANFKKSEISDHSLSELVNNIRAVEEGLQTHDNASSGRAIILQPSLRRLRFGLVAHFIKKQDAREQLQFFNEEVRPLCRDSKVRRESDQAARALVKVLKNTPGLSTLVRGIDAASNERHASPEVFAPAFRRMHAAGVKRFTYHAGEDFVHIASGLRAMFEAVRFLELDAGCRIGHGTASGLDVEAWWKSVGSHIVMPLEDRLDDLLFARHMLLCCRISLLQLPLIDSEIQRLAHYIWDDPKVMPDDLTHAWLIRELDPLAQESNLNDVDPRRRAEACRLDKARRAHPIAYELFLRRHGQGAQSAQLKRCREDIVIARDSDILDDDLLRNLQNYVLSELSQRQIAIETLPSSNIRISIHDTYDNHHAQNWLYSSLAAANGPVCFTIGSDDPGIFATSLRMEYAHFLRPLQKKGSQKEGIERPDLLLEKICLDAKKFRF